MEPSRHGEESSAGAGDRKGKDGTRVWASPAVVQRLRQIEAELLDVVDRVDADSAPWGAIDQVKSLINDLAKASLAANVKVADQAKARLQRIEKEVALVEGMRNLTRSMMEAIRTTGRLDSPVIQFHLQPDDLHKIASAKHRAQLDLVEREPRTVVTSVALDERDVELFVKEAVRAALERLR